MKYFITSLFLFILGYFGLLNPIKNIFMSVTAPFQFGLRNTSVQIKDFFGFYINLTKLHRENIKLIEDKIALESKILELAQLKTENSTLREQLGHTVRIPQSKQYVLVRVMGNPNDLTGATVVLDKGTRDGVFKGNNVVLGGYAVGKISESYVDRSIVELITSPTSVIAVYDIDTPQQTEALAVGDHGFSVLVEKLLPTEEIRVGDTFVTSGKDGQFLPGFIIGRVSDILEDPSQPLKKARTKTIFDIKRLDSVFVIAEK